MENGKWTASPEHSLLLQHSLRMSTNPEDDDEEADDSRLDFNFDAIEADIDLDDSIRSNPRLAIHSGHASSQGTSSLSEGQKARTKTIDRWSSSTGKPATMTLKEQEKVIDELKKESFSLKLKIYFLEERLAKISPEHVDQALHENIEMKVRLQTMHSELKQYKRLLLEAHAAIEALQAQRNCDLAHGMTLEQEEEHRKAIAEGLQLKEALTRMAKKLESLEEEARTRDRQVEKLQARLGEMETSAEAMKELQEKSHQYEDEIRQLREQLLEAQQSEARNLEQTRMEEEWRTRYQKLEQEFDSSLEMRSALEEELLATRSERTLFEEEMNRQLEQYRDELSDAKLQITELSHQVNDEREHLLEAQELHSNDMNTLSERWTLDRQQLRDQISEMDAEMEELRKQNEQLVPQIEDLEAWRNEDAMRHDQELADMVAEIEDKTAEIERLSSDLGNIHALQDALQSRDSRISQLEDQIEQLEIQKREAAEVHDEVIALMKAKIHSGPVLDDDNAAVTIRDVQILSEELALYEEQNRKLESQLQLEIQLRLDLANSSRNKEADEVGQWTEERQRMKQEFEDQTHGLHNKLAQALEQISELSEDILERDNNLRFYEEQLDLATKRSKEVEERYEDMEFKLNSALDATRAELLGIQEEFEQIRASRVESGNLLNVRSHEVDRLNTKLRKHSATVATLEEDKTQLETALRDRATTIAMLKSRLNELEMQVSKKQWDDETPAANSKHELTERNSLLLTVLQHLDSILGGDSRLDSSMLPKPSANFGYFSNHLTSRLKSLSKLFILFEKKAKELENKSTEQLVQLKKQLDMKLQQLDRFETIVRTAADRQRKWREQLVKKQADNEELQLKVAHLTKNLVELKGRSGLSERNQDYEARCKHAERKLQMEKSRLVDSEERWNARLRELEKRTKDAEERVKRERQGAKEKVASLLDENKASQKNVESLQRRNAHLQELVDLAKNNTSTSNKSKLTDREYSYTNM